MTTARRKLRCGASRRSRLATGRAQTGGAPGKPQDEPPRIPERQPPKKPYRPGHDVPKPVPVDDPKPPRPNERKRSGRPAFT